MPVITEEGTGSTIDRQVAGPVVVLAQKVRQLNRDLLTGWPIHLKVVPARLPIALVLIDLAIHGASVMIRPDLLDPADAAALEIGANASSSRQYQSQYRDAQAHRRHREIGRRSWRGR